MVSRQDDGSYKLRWDVIATVVAWLVGGLLAYGSLDARIKVLEVQQQSVVDSLRDIKTDTRDAAADIKKLLQREPR